MNHGLRLIIFLNLLIFSACSTFSVRSDYDTEFNFSQFKTYKLVNKSSSKAESKLPVSLGFQRISRAVDKDLQQKGFSKKELEPDVIIVFQTSVEKKLSVETTNYRRWSGVWVAEHEVREYNEGLLVLDFINRVTKNVVWRGWVKGIDKNMEGSQEKVDEIIKELLSGFPPMIK